MSRSRSRTGNHDLLPANNKHAPPSPHVPLTGASPSIFARGTIIWRIWPAVLLHAVFATVIVTISQKTNVNLGIPNILLTLLGVVIGFVMSLRVSSGYDRYWWGRCAWSDLIKNSRTFSRLVWIHAPPRITNPTGKSNARASSEEIGQAMREKRIALELLQAFAVSLKHHVRGELGIYYEDLYHVVRPFHEHHGDPQLPHIETHLVPPMSHSVKRHPSRQYSIESYAQTRPTPPHSDSATLRVSSSSQNSLTARKTSRQNSSLGSQDPVIPPLNAYESLRFTASRTSLVSSHSSDQGGERDPLLPSSLPGPKSGASTGLVPFTSVFAYIGHFLNPRRWMASFRANFREGQEGSDEAGGAGSRWGKPQHQHDESRSTSAEVGHGHGKHRKTRQTHNGPGKHRPRVTGDGQNLPLEIIRCLSEWLSQLEARGTVGGNALGGMFSCLSSFEDCLSTLERILETPLPYVYAVHIRHTVWLYLFFLPFQLADSFNWYAIPGTAIAAFFYLGFIAAGEEIEQPFGYDENDLDLDLFCHDVIQADIHTLTATPFPNTPMGSHHTGLEINEASTVVDVSLGKHHEARKHETPTATMGQFVLPGS